MEVLGSIFWLIVALGLLVTFHEFGHYWVARRAGVKVLRFSVGFGRPLLKRRAADGVEFVLAAIPLGGYVKMLDEREGPVAPAERDQAFNRASLGKRSAIVLAGPVFNLIFAVAAFWAMFMIGIPESRPLLGQPEGLARQAGFEHGDLIVQIERKPVETWTHAVLALMPAALDRRSVTVTVERASGIERELELALDQLGPEFREDRLLQALGISPWQPDLPAVIGEVSGGSPAEQAGLRPGDRIVEIAGAPVDGWRELVGAIQQAAAAGGAVDLVVERDSKRQAFSIQPEQVDGRPIIGIVPPEADAATRARMERAFTILHHGPVQGLGEAVAEVGRLTGATLGILGRMITGDASLSNLSGPITIAQLANDSASLGLTRFLFFLGLISLSLAIINLLPIPVLDGGHLLFFAIEWLKGSPVSEQGHMIGNTIGMLMVFSLMGIAVFNDLLRLIQ